MHVEATVDRFEGGRAVLLVEGLPDAVIVPRKLIPSDAREGSILLISIEILEDATRRARDEAERSTKRLSEDE